MEVISITTECYEMYINGLERAFIKGEPKCNNGFNLTQIFDGFNETKTATACSIEPVECASEELFF